MTKDSDPAELIRAVTEVLHGRPYVCSGSESIGFERDEAPTMPHEALSDREHQVLRMLVKLGMTHTAELIRYAIENELIDS